MNSKIKNAFNQAAKSYDEHCHLQLSIGMKLLDLLSQHHFNSPRIIDLGCGTGIVTEKLASAFQYQSLHAIDFADYLLNKASARLSHFNIQVYHADFDHLPKYEEPFDIIFSNMALHWSAHFQETLKFITSQLSKNGVFAFAIPLHGTLTELEPHFSVNPFLHLHSLFNLLTHNQCEVLTHHNEKILLHFNNTLAALKSIKQVGANSVPNRSLSCLQGKSFINRIQLHELTYHIGYFIVRKMESICQSNYLLPAPTQTSAKHSSVSDY